MVEQSLEGKVALVTGGASGIGLAIAIELARAGACVVLGDLNVALASESLRAVEQAGPGKGHSARLLNVADSASVDAVVDEICAEHGHVDIMINNAGVSLLGPHVIDFDDESWHTSIAVMQSGVFFGMRAVGRAFKRQGSGICINISSIRGFSPRPGRIAYCATKAAVIMMTQVAAIEWAPFGARCVAIAPGVQRTPMWDTDVARGVVDEEAIMAVTPAHRMGDPAEVGRLAVFLASDQAEYLTGACIPIDGALSLMPSDAVGAGDI